MASGGMSALDTMEDIEAALAELEKLSPGEAETIPSLDDGPAPDEEALSSAQAAADTPEEPPAGEASTGNPAAPKEAAAESVDPAAEPRFCRALARGLDALGRPLAACSPAVRNAIGLAGLVTLVVSLLALILAPRLMPQRDAITLLREKRAELNARLKAPERPPPTSREPVSARSALDPPLVGPPL